MKRNTAPDDRGLLALSWTDAGIVALLGLIVVAIYARSLSNFFTADDYQWLELAKLITRGQASLLTDRYFYFRPVHVLVLSIMYQWFGMNPLPYHVLSVLTHAVVSALVYCLGRLVLKHRGYAFLAAGIFAVGVSHAMTVFFLSCMHDVLPTAFGLAAIIFWLLYLQRPRILFYLLAALSVFLSLLSKEVGIVLLVLLPLAELLFKPDPAPWSMKRAYGYVSRYSVFGVVLLVYGVLRLSGQSPANPNFHVGPHIVTNVLSLFLHMILPVTAHFMMLLHLPGGIYTVVTLGRLALLVVGLALVAGCLWRGSAPMRFSIALIFIPLLPAGFYYPPSGLRELPMDIPSWYTYLPSVGFSLFLVLLLRYLLRLLSARWPQSVRIRYVAVACVLAYMLVNAAAVPIYGEMSFKRITDRQRNIVRQLDMLAPSIQVTDSLYFEGDNSPWLEMRVGSLFSDFWDLYNPITLVFPDESGQIEWARQWPLGIKNRPRVVMDSFRDMMSRCDDPHSVFITYDGETVRLVRCGQPK